MNKKLNLYQKLVEIRKEVTYLQKSAKGYKYSYVEEHQILSIIRPKMDDLGVVLEIDMVTLEPVDYLKGVRAVFNFTWVNADNPEEKTTKQVVMQNPGLDAKSVGSLMTYANRYFLLKFFNVPTSELDPDIYQESLKTEIPASNEPISKEQIDYLIFKINGNEDIKKKILSRCAGNLKNFTMSQYESILEWISKREIENESIYHPVEEQPSSVTCTTNT